MKAEKLAIWPWLSCRYTKNTLMDKPWTPAIPIHFKDKYLATPQANLLQELVYQSVLRNLPIN